MKIKTIHLLTFIFLIIVFTFTSCEDSFVLKNLSNQTEREPSVETEDPSNEYDEIIYIVDITGKRWDITHAVNQYGFVPEQFQYGLGPDAIKPILNPQMLSPGNSGYPDDNNTGLVIGSNIEESPRAYPLQIMKFHEVADEEINDVFVAVAY